MRQMPAAEREKFGASGREFLVQNLSKRRVVAQHFSSELDELYEGGTLNQAAGI